MTPEDLAAVMELLDRRTRALAAVRGSAVSRCPACGLLVPDRLVAEHCRAYGDEDHVVAEVMSS
jgi:hypothetical protein